MLVFAGAVGGFAFGYLIATEVARYKRIIKPQGRYVRPAGMKKVGR